MTSSPETLHVGVLGGTWLPGNVETFVRNIGRLLEIHPVDFQFDLLVRDRSTGNIPGFDVVDPGINDTGRALGTLQTLTSATTRYAANHPVDVLFQVTKFPVHGFAATVAGRRTSTPVVTRFAGNNFREYLFSEGVGERVQTFALNNLVGTVPARLSDATVVLGSYGRAEIERRNGGGVVREIPQPVDFERFHPVSNREQEAIREKFGITVDDRVLLTVGRLSKRKGIQDLVAAARTLAIRDVDVRWYVVGDGPLREKLEETPLVKPVGHVSHERVPEYYRAADLLVHPSLIEGLPNVLLEAAACGIPTVSRNVGEAATVASATYDDPAQLPDLVLRDFDAVDLGDRFDPETLREAYAELLVDIATRQE